MKWWIWIIILILVIAFILWVMFRGQAKDTS